MAKKKTTKETGNSLNAGVVFDSVFVPENIEKIDTRLRIIKWGKDNDYAQFFSFIGSKRTQFTGNYQQENHIYFSKRN